MSDRAASVTSEAFDRLMAELGPFEPRPHVAAAVSGGPDSMALALLLADWLAPRGGRLTAFTVDHGLRPESAEEAAWVAKQLKPLGVAHRTLRWEGPKPLKKSGSSYQAAARAARYALLLKACETRGIFHLALAHHLEDQAETFLLRLGRGSGLDGLAAMAPVSETSGLRLLRPLLSISKAQLVELLAARGQEWVEDPSNADGAFARVRLRRLLPELADEGMTPARLGSASHNLGRARAALEADVAAALARAVRPDPAGFLDLDPALLRRESAEVSLRALARCLMAVGGCDYTPRLERLERLHAYLESGLARGVTLGGCRILPRKSSAGAERWLIVREAGRSAEAALKPGGALLWDGRFEVRLSRGATAETREKSAGEMTIGPLGSEGWRRLAKALEAVGAGARAARIPTAARGALPALRDRAGLAAVPPVGYFRDAGTAKRLKECRFAPTNGLTNPAFTVV
ncbi:tRNA lysidine(34) synthetase TilS [Pelagibius marinus]|uniref:tRNA lysidine(34) synthetase TilS n=1 Tax=Pelagibius marinus TaxID=2762760 RepID=UPI0018721DA7|nr:tRNA lysidine(34) synthetase TilS [Pelagibius marinus]